MPAQPVRTSARSAGSGERRMLERAAWRTTLPGARPSLRGAGRRVERAERVARRAQALVPGLELARQAVVHVRLGELVGRSGQLLLVVVSHGHGERRRLEREPGQDLSQVVVEAAVQRRQLHGLAQVLETGLAVALVDQREDAA